MNECAYCGSPLIGGYVTRRTCNATCRQRLWEQRHGLGRPLGHGTRRAAQLARLALVPPLPEPPSMPVRPTREVVAEPPEDSYWAWPPHKIRATDRPPLDEARCRAAAVAAMEGYDPVDKLSVNG